MVKADAGICGGQGATHRQGRDSVFDRPGEETLS